MKNKFLNEHVNSVVGIIAIVLSLIAIFQSKNQSVASVYSPIFEKQIEIISKTSSYLKEIQFKSSNLYGYMCVTLYLKNNEDKLYEKLIQTFDDRLLEIDHNLYDEFMNDFSLWMPEQLDTSYSNVINKAYLFSNEIHNWKPKDINNINFEKLKSFINTYHEHYGYYIDDIRNYYMISKASDIFRGFTNSKKENRLYLDSGIDQYLLDFAKKYNLPEECFTLPIHDSEKA